MAQALKVAPGGKGTRRQVDPMDHAHLPTLPCPSAWPELGSPGGLEPQEAASNSAREASSLVMNTWAQLCPLDAEAKHEPGLHHETGSSLGGTPPQSSFSQDSFSPVPFSLMPCDPFPESTSN